MLRLCQDPIVEVLRDVFHCNIIQVPETRIQPMGVVSCGNQRSRYCGDLNQLLRASNAIQPTLLEDSRMADVSARRSRSVRTTLGLEIMDGFLRGFGVPSAGIKAEFGGAKAISFSFQNVIRKYVDITLLGTQLQRKRIKKSHPVVKGLLRTNDSLMVVDSIITSSDFSISIVESRAADFELDVPAIEAVLADANAGVRAESTSARDISFKGDEHLTFAFSCIQIYFDASGVIDYIDPQLKQVQLRATSTGPHRLKPNPVHVLMVEDRQMIEVE